ncbi:DUF4349 domain-containing protein [Patescibacteria group bacterium]|nr:DUF4349 domain-containing protein [Patescibacteria group bacterium]MBU1705611.1 DUF4349 domain-containing protein [Patescibacteria group bacterium]
MKLKTPSYWYYFGGAIILGVIIIIGAALSWPGATSLTQNSSVVDFATKTLSLDRSESAGSAGMPVMDLAYAEPSMMPIPSPTGGETAAEVDQRIIKTGALNIVVDDVGAAATQITTLATGQGGFVQDSSVSEREDGTHYGYVTVRVPAEQFESVMTNVKKLANVVENESVTGQDVTEQYTDLEARLRNAQAQEATYLRILDQAKTVEDTLSVQRELTNIRYQIESLQGQLKYLSNKTDYSTISVYLSEEPTVGLPTKEFRPWTSVKEAVRALGVVGQNLVIAAIWVAVIGGGVLLPLGLIIWLIVKIVRRFRQRK